MKEFKQKVNKIVDEVNQNWVVELEKSEQEETPINLAKVIGKYSKLVMDLNNEFIMFEERNKKKRGLF